MGRPLADAAGACERSVPDALPGDERQGFATAVSYFVARNSNAALAAVGGAIARTNGDVSEARNRGENGFFSLGFDIATGIYGDQRWAHRASRIPCRVPIKRGYASP
jgi:hypothetical protein